MVKNSTIGKLSFDFHESDEYKQSLYNEKIIFVLNYVIIIPFLLFLLSRILRCLRHRGWVSHRSERRIVDDIESRMVNVAAGEIPLIALSQSLAAKPHDSLNK